MRSLRLFAASLTLLAFSGCGGSDSDTSNSEGGDSGGNGRAGGGGAAAQGGSSQGGGAQGGSGQGKAGAAGNVAAGNSGAGGKGQAGSGQGGAGQGGAGNGGAGQGGKGGAAQAGKGGAQGGDAGASHGGEGGAAQGGEAGQGGAAQAGQGGDGQGGAQGGSAQAGQGGDGGAAGGAAGDAGAAGQGGGAQGGGAQGGSAQGGEGGQGGAACPGVTVGAPCYDGPAGTEGVGACVVGSLACVNGAAVCQGQVLPSGEACDNLDNDCNGQIDDGLGTLSCGSGICANTVDACVGGVSQVCSPLPSQPEACNGVDDSCDGQIDEGCACLDGQVQPCYGGAPDTLGVGVCVGGTSTCAAGQWGPCVGEVQPGAELCDNLDNDCNGQIDEGLGTLSCGSGACANTVEACVGGVAQVCLPLPQQTEVCNSIDDDCDGQIDENNVCCPQELRCAGLCCAAGQVCSFGKCETPGLVCTSSEECGAGFYCDFSIEAPPSQCQGSPQKAGKCLPRPPQCGPGQPPGDPPVCLTKCEYKPANPTFLPTLKYSWGGQIASPFATDIMMTPIVVQLDDDDCDGKVTARDIPEIVFTTFTAGAYNGNGVLHAISVVKGAVVDKWSVSGVHGTKQIAGGNLDGVGGAEIVACNTAGALAAYHSDGTLFWTTAATTCFMPQIADLDQDGKPEVIVEGGVHDGMTGALKATFTPGLGAPFVISDIDGDGRLDIVTSGKAYRGDGTLIVDTGLAAATAFPNTGDWKGPWAAVADFDLDGKPEVVGLDNVNHNLVVWRYDASVPAKFTALRTTLDINGPLSPSLCPGGSWGNTHGGGPLTVGDFNADGTPDVAFAGGVGYAVIDGKKLIDAAVPPLSTFLWGKQTSDCSSASTGSSLFDFNGDGKAEVVYSDEFRLRIYEGATGNTLFETCNTTATLIENPIIADVDNDGQADIVVISNAYARTCDGTKQSGVRIFGSADNSWVRTRRVWNQHPYHITNIDEDGTVPAVEAPNWQQPGLNNFRQNKQPAGEFSAPDLIISLSPTCSGPYAMVALVRNVGETSVPAGVKVGFYVGGQKIGEMTTTQTLYPAEAEELSLSLPQPPAGDVTAIVDDGSPAHPWHECRTDNNSATSPPACVQLGAHERRQKKISATPAPMTKPAAAPILASMIAASPARSSGMPAPIMKPATPSTTAPAAPTASTFTMGQV